MLNTVTYYVAKKQDKSYWANPQVYITSGIKAAPHNAHFVLHRFQTNDLKPLDDNPEHANVRGELRYQVSLTLDYS